MMPALVGAAAAGFAWHMYVQSATGQGTSPQDKYLWASVAAGGLVGYYVGKRFF